MEIRIYTKDDILRMVAAAGEGDRATCGIQQESMLTLSFTAFECVALEVYDYVDFEGARYWVTARYLPKMTARREWSYSLQLHGVEGLAAQTLLVNPTDGKDDPLVTLTAPAREHAALIVANLNRRMNTTIWKVGEVVVSEYIHIEYTGKYASDALSELSAAANTEWWFDGVTLNISRCEFGAPLPLAYGQGLLGDISRTLASGVKFFTRLFPVGSSRNINPDKYGAARLQLPGRNTYVEQDTDLGVIEHYEQEAFADIYPRRVGRVGAVRSVERKGEDGEPFTIWYFADPEIPFNPNDYEIGGLVKQVTFQSGELRGYTFEVNYDSKNKEFEIITQWPYDDAMQLPSPPLIPATGDEYVLWNISLPESYYTLAEEEFQAAVEKFMEEARRDVSVFGAQTDFTVVGPYAADLKPGQRVRLHSAEYFPDKGYRDTRIVSVSRSVEEPGSMTLSMSDVLSTGRISRIESDIVRVEQLTRTISSEMPDIIRSWEETPASDTTLYSSRKSEREFLNKRRGGTVEEDVQFAKSVAVGGSLRSREFAAGMTGHGYGFGEGGDGEVESFVIRRFLEVPELRYNRTDVVVGDQWRAACVGLVAEVAVDDDGLGGIVTLKLEEGEAGSVEAGDICMGIFHAPDEELNATEDYDDSCGNRRFAGFATVYFSVAEVLDTTASRFRYTLRPASAKYPRPVHPQPSMTFVGYGSFTDPARRTSVYATRTYERYLKDVADWEFAAGNIAAQFGDLQNLSVHGIEMAGYSAYIDNLYMRGAMQSLDRMFRLDTRTKELLFADTASGVGLSFAPGRGLTIGSVYDPLTGRFKDEYDLAQMRRDLDDLGYLGVAFKNDTQIAGGLIQSSLLRMGYVDEATGRWVPKSGTSGIFDATKMGGGIASWYGGDMIDMADYYVWNDAERRWVLKPGIDAVPDNIAQGVDRMDGSGYRAGGAIWWGVDGKAYADPMSFFVGEKTVGNVLELFRFNFKIGAADQDFANVVSVTPQRSFTRLQIGDGVITWDAAEGAFKFDHVDAGKTAGLYATKFVSSKGPNSDGGGGAIGATTLAALTDVTLSSPIIGDVLQYNGQRWVNTPMSSIKPDLAGYATQQWVKDQGYLTQHQSLAGYVTLNTEQTIAGLKGFATSPYAILPSAAGAAARGFNLKNHKGEAIGGFGAYAIGNVLNWLYLGWSSDPWLAENCISFGADRFKYKGLDVLHAGNYTSLLDGRYAKVANSMTFADDGNVYINASLPATLRKKAVQGYIEFWDGGEGGGWFHFKVGKISVDRGTAEQFLKADGSVDSNSYVRKSGDTMTGPLTVGGYVKGTHFLATTTTLCTDLNADLLDGKHAASFAQLAYNPADLNSLDGFGFAMQAASANATAAGHYPIQEAGALIYCNAAYSKSNQIYGSFSSNRWFARGGGNTSRTTWREFAFLDSTVASASKLATSRSLWGQPFDGSADVTGSLTGVVSITSSSYYRTEGYGGASWDNGVGALSVGINNNSAQTPLLLAYRAGTWSALTGANRLFAAELLNTGTQLRFSFGGAVKFYFESDGTFHSTKGLWAADYVSSKGQNTSSDARLKTVLRPVALTMEQIAEAPAVVYAWRDGSGVDVGSIAQYWQDVLPEGVRRGRDGYLAMAYDKIALAASILTARRVLDHEQRIALLERENRELKRQLRQIAA